MAKSKKKDTPQLIVDLTSSILAVARKAMSQNEFARVLRVENAEFKRYNAYYVTISRECDFNGYATQIKNELGVEVDFINLNYDFDKCVALLCAN